MKKIKILHVVLEMGLGGYENYLMNVYRNIDRDKYQFDFMVLKTREAFFEKEIKKLGGEVFHFSFSEDFKVCKLKREMKETFKDKHYDIVHCHNRYYSFFYLPVLKKITDNIVIHSHTANREKTFKGFLVWFFGQYPAKNKKYYKAACSEKAGKYVFKKQAFTVLPNCIETNNFKYDDKAALELRKQFNISENEIIIGHVGRFAPVKNHDFILKMFKELISNTDKKYRLCLCGVGARKEEIMKTVSSDPVLKDKVTFLPTGDISKYYSLFSYFILPSFHEGFPLSLLESQAAGCISLASEAITKEVKLTSALTYLDIKETKPWIECLLNSKQYNKEERIEFNSQIAGTCYDAKNATKVLCAYYNKILNNKD